MLFEQIDADGDRNFAYLFADEATREAVLVDPGGPTDRILDHVLGQNLEVKYVVNTHSHLDHSGGNRKVQDRTGARVVLHESVCGRPDTEIGVKDGDELKVGGLTLKFIHTPGHTDDSVCVLCGNKLCTGDTLFVGKVGGTGFGEDAREEYDSIHQKIMTLPEDVEICPGHNYGVAPTSTVGHERRTNPFLLRKSFEEFVDLKRNWLEYKRIHGIA